MKTFLCLLSIFAVALVGRAEIVVAPVAVRSSETAPECVLQRDADGRVRVQREVHQNAQGDYVNHGVWREWDDAGRLIGQGRYESGKPTGPWMRWAAVEDLSPPLAERVAGFTGPFLSQANYCDGRLEGVWSIYDAESRLVSEVRFREGLRDGATIDWTPAGQICRRWHFERGRPSGELQTLSERGGLVTAARFESGREVIQRSEHYENGRLKSRVEWLGGVQRPVESDDPRRLRLARFEASGDELRSGLREAWWPNGRPKLRVEYRLGKAVGAARWWHENGQLALCGGYDEGLASGQWNWWRESGLKAASCRYEKGRPAGEWSLWAADGQRQPATSAPSEPGPGKMVQRPGVLLVR